MKTAIAILLAAAVGTVAAEPHTVVTPCTACKGERSLSLTPPNLGQHDGEIDVTPGKPFTSHRWDVKHSRCPLCKGTGRHEKWVFRVRPPEDRADKEPCATCWWSGAEPCRKCNHTGLADCQKCKSSRHGSKPGWIVEETKTTSRSSFRSYGRSSSRQHKKIKVTPCPECGGSRYSKEAGLIHRIPKKSSAGYTLPELMDMSIDEALQACDDLPLVKKRLQVLHDLGLGYLTLGEETPSLSGGEAQRLKLAGEMGKGQSDSVFVFDEPRT